MSKHAVVRERKVSRTFVVLVLVIAALVIGVAVKSLLVQHNDNSNLDKHTTCLTDNLTNNTNNPC